MVRPRTMVRAQRKFAQKAYIPGAVHYKCDAAAAEQRPDQQIAAPASPVQKHLNMPVGDLLDAVSYQRVYHQDNGSPLRLTKRVRVLLERISPDRGLIGNVVTPAEPGPSRPPQPATNRRKQVVKRLGGTQKPIKKVNIRTPSPVVSEKLRDLTVMRLRTRQIAREWPGALNIRVNQRGVTGRRVDLSSRRLSETSNDDNRPLVYLIRDQSEVNLKKKILPQKKMSAVQEKSIRNVKKNKSTKRNKTKRPRSRSPPRCVTRSRSNQEIAESGNLPKMSRVATLSDDEANLICNTAEPDCLDDGFEAEQNVQTNQAMDISTYSIESQYDVEKAQELPIDIREDNNLCRVDFTYSIFKSETSPFEELRCASSAFGEINQIPNTTSPLADEINQIPSPTNSLAGDIPTNPVADEINQIPSPTNPLAGEINQIPRPTNPLADFVISIFNWNDGAENMNSDACVQSREDRTELDTIEENNSVTGVDECIERVQEWLVTNNVAPKPSGDSSAQFKIPEAPRRDNRSMIRPPPSVCSTRSIIPTFLSPKERALRKACTSWNYNTLSNAMTNPELIRRFCAECTRCKLMFRLENSHTLLEKRGSFPSSLRPMSVVSGSVSDIYEFNSERDCSLQITPYRPNRTDGTTQLPELENSKFVQISNHPDYAQKLKNCMTEKGKKMLRAANIIKHKLHNVLKSTDRSVLAQVIGILNECNAARIEDRLPPALRATPSPLVTETQRESRGVSGDDQPKRKECRVVLKDSQQTPRESRIVLVDCQVNQGVNRVSRISDSQQQQRPSTSQRLMVTEAEVSPVKRTRHVTNHERESSILQPGFLTSSPKFFPTPKEFAESPTKYAMYLLRKHPNTSLCGIKPPASFKPTFKNDGQQTIKLSNQYIHRMLQRWGLATRDLTAIRSKQDPKIQRSPLFEGLEIDLVRLFRTVQEEGGIEILQNDREKWIIVAKRMGLLYCNKGSTKLENIYLKYLLAYNTLTSTERDAALEDVQKCWLAREEKAVFRAEKPLWRQKRMIEGLPLADDDSPDSHIEKVCAEAEECVTPGRTCNAAAFKKLANKVQKTYFPTTSEPTPEDVEKKYWEVVMSGNDHACIHTASVDSSDQNCGFEDHRSDPSACHFWNLKRLGMSSSNLLSYLGPTLGVSSTTLHYGMLFATSCWHMDPTMVPWIEYLHQGAPKIWYSVSADQADQFRTVVETLCPTAVQKKDIWLPCDIVMIPPVMLEQHGVNVERHIQYAGEYVIIYPKTYCACIDTGFVISEGVYFAPFSWITKIESVFMNLRSCCEPSLFSLEKLLVVLSKDPRTPISVLQQTHTVLTSLLQSELSYRQRLISRGIELMTPQVFRMQNSRSTAASWQIQQMGECAYCRCHIYLSRVLGLTEGQTGLCALHGVHMFEHASRRGDDMTGVCCVVLVTEEEITEIIGNLKARLSVFKLSQLR